MRNADEILKLVLRDLGRVYDRPLMYGGDANGVDVAFWLYHDLWADIVDRREDLESIRSAQFDEIAAGARNFSDHYRECVRNGCTEAEAARYSVSEWKRIDAKLGLVLLDDLG